MPVAVTGMTFSYLSHNKPNPVTGEIYPEFFEQGAAFVIEEVFTMADHPPVTGYFDQANVVLPKFDENFENSRTIRFIKQMRSQLIGYIEALEKSVILKMYFREYTEISLNNCRRFLIHPHRVYVNLISCVDFNSDQTHDVREVRRLASRLYISDLIKMTLHVLMRKPYRYIDREHGWYTACAVISPVYIRVIYFLMYRTFKFLKRMNSL